jgi:hypothetical protein
LITKSNPNTKEKVNALFANKTNTIRYIRCIQHTPLELRDKFHQCALDHWEAMYPLKQGTQQVGNVCCCPEPSPYDDTFIWKRWLKSKCDYPPLGQPFKYLGIPQIGQAFHSMHIEGVKALLCFLPRASKGIKGPICGPIRDAFLQAAAILLIVPERYQHIVGQLKLTIAPSCSRQHYNKSCFGDENHINKSSITHFFMTIRVTRDEAEKWQPWVAAYVNMELYEQTDNTIAKSLHQARQRAHA